MGISVAVGAAVALDLAAVSVGVAVAGVALALAAVSVGAAVAGVGAEATEDGVVAMAGDGRLGSGLGLAAASTYPYYGGYYPGFYSGYGGCGCGW